MPEFPRTNSDRSLTTQQPLAQRNDADIRSEAQDRTKITTDAISKTQDAAIKWNTAVEEIQKDTLVYNMKIGAQEIVNDAVLDTDINAEAKYQKRWENLRKTATAGIGNASLVNRIAPELDYMQKMGSLAITQEFRKKIIAHGQVMALNNINFEVQNPNPESEKNIENITYKAWKTGLIDETAARKLRVDSIQDVRFNRFLQEYREDPIGAEKKFSSGGYALDIETSEKARSKLKELQRIYKEAEGDRYNELALGILTGETSDAFIDQQLEANKRNPNEGITESHALQLKKALYRDVKQRIGAKEYEKHKKAIDLVFSDSQVDKMKAYEGVLAAYQDGLSNDDTRFLSEIVKMKKTKEWRNKTWFVKEALWDAMGWSMPNATIEEKTNALLDWAQRIAGGTDPEEASRVVMHNQQVKAHPALAMNPDLDGSYSPKSGVRLVGPKVKQESK